MREIKCKGLVIVCTFVLFLKQVKAQDCLDVENHVGYGLFPEFHACGQRQMYNATKKAENPDHDAALGEFPWMVLIKPFYDPEWERLTSPYSPELCDESTKIDLIFNTYDDNLIVFKGDSYWKITFGPGGKSTYSKPQLIAKTWINLPANIEAAFTVNLTPDPLPTVLFFIYGEVYAYRRNRDKKYRLEYGWPRNQTKLYPGIERFVDAAMQYDYKTVGIFRGQIYFTYDGTTRVSHVEKAWNGIPLQINAAVNLRRNGFYFFRDNTYYKFNKSTGNVTDVGSVYQLLGCEPNPIDVPPPPSLCVEPSYDLIINSEDSGPYFKDKGLYVLRGAYYWKVKNNKTDGPHLIIDKWPGLPAKADAGFYYKDRYYFFKGSRTYVYRYHSVRDVISFEVSLDIFTMFPYIPENIDAVFVDEVQYAGYITETYLYFFKGAHFWIFDNSTNKIRDGYPKPIALIDDMPENIYAAVSFDKEHTYVFKDQDFYRLHFNFYKVANDVPHYPRSVANFWFGCKGTAHETLCNHPTYNIIYNPFPFGVKESSVFVIRGPHWWRVSKGRILDGPDVTSKFWPGLPENVRAAYTDNVNTYFFTDLQVWSYKRLVSYDYHVGVGVFALNDGYPKLIEDELSIFGDLDAVLKYDDRYTYFFAGSQSYRRTLNKTDLDGSFIDREFPGVPSKLDSATWVGDELYFFKNGSYYHFNTTLKKVDPPEAYPVAADWFGCEDSPPSGILDGKLNTQYVLNDKSLKNLNCSGVILNANYILAPASCFVHPNGTVAKENSIIVYLPQDNSHYTIDCATTKCLRNRKFVNVIKLMMHEEYKPGDVSRKNNIALLRVENFLHFSNYLQPACLPLPCGIQQRNFAIHNHHFTTIGWGIHRQTAALEPFRWLQKVDIHFNSNYDCYIDGNKTELTTTETCMKSEVFHDTCDFWWTGNPVFFVDKVYDPPKFVLYGLPQSDINHCPLEGDLNIIYDRIPAYLKWILDTVVADKTLIPDHKGVPLHVAKAGFRLRKYKCDDPVIEALLPVKKCGKSVHSLEAWYARDKYAAKFGEFPWTVVVHTTMEIPGNGPTSSDCNGVLISSRYVLTAAHCLTLSPPLPEKETSRKIWVTLGEYDKFSHVDCINDPDETDKIICLKYELVEVDKYFIHGKFDPFTLRNDIALLHLSKEANFSYWVQPICLPMSCRTQEIVRVNTEIYDTVRPHYYLFNNITQTGWALYGGQGYKTYMQRLQSERVPIEDPISNGKLSCAEYKWLDNHTQYCVIYDLKVPNPGVAEDDYEKSSCDMDTGGPLIAQIEERFHLLGISSITEDCKYEHWSTERDATVYTKITSYLNWIMERIFYNTFGLEDIGDEFDEEDEDYSIL